MKVSLKPLLLVLVIGLIVFPFVYLPGLSLAAEWPFPALWPGYLGWRHWREVLSSDNSLLQSFGLSVVISLSVATAATLTGFFISRTLAFHPRKRSLSLLIYFPYVLAPVVLAVCLSYFFLKVGLFGKMSGVILAQFMIALPYAILFFRSFWNERALQVEQLVATLGGNRRQTFFRAILPLAQGMLLVCFFQTFLISWFEYGLTALIGVGKVQTLTVKVFLFIKEANYFQGALSCCLLIFPPVVLLYLNRRFVFQRII